MVRPISVNPNYVLVFLKSRTFIETGIPKMTGTAGQKRVPTEYFAFAPFPLAPLSEQHRIVAKVDELMALCDELEAAQAKREKRRDKLNAASITRINTEFDPEVFKSHVRFHLDNFDKFTIRPDQIPALRQTILNLAVRGKLVAQDPKDVPASLVLKAIEKLRTEKLVSGYPNSDEARSQLAKQKQQTVPANIPVLPKSWQWATLMQCSILVVDCHNKTAPYKKDGFPLVRTSNIKSGTFIHKGLKYVDEPTYQRWSARCVPESGDILITREAPMGEVCMIPDGMKICLGQRIMLLRVDDSLINRDFLLYSLRDPFLMDRVQDKPVGATVQHLRVGGVETLLVPVPPKQEQDRIVLALAALMALCDELEASLRNTQAVSLGLIQSLLTDALVSPR